GDLTPRGSFGHRDRPGRVAALLAVVGVVNVPIIHSSVEWWSTLHQAPTLTKFDNPSITLDMLLPLLVMILGFTLCFGWLVFTRLQGQIVEREHDARWLQQFAAEAAR